MTIMIKSKLIVIKLNLFDKYLFSKVKPHRVATAHRHPEEVREVLDKGVNNKGVDSEVVLVVNNHSNRQARTDPQHRLKVAPTDTVLNAHQSHSVVAAAAAAAADSVDSNNNKVVDSEAAVVTARVVALVDNNSRVVDKAVTARVEAASVDSNKAVSVARAVATVILQAVLGALRAQFNNSTPPTEDINTNLLSISSQ